MIRILVVLELSLVVLDLLPHFSSSTATAKKDFSAICPSNQPNFCGASTPSVVHGELSTFLGGMGSKNVDVCVFRQAFHEQYVSLQSVVLMFSASSSFFKLWVLQVSLFFLFCQLVNYTRLRYYNVCRHFQHTSVNMAQQHVNIGMATLFAVIFSS